MISGLTDQTVISDDDSQRSTTQTNFYALAISWSPMCSITQSSNSRW